MIVFLLAQAFSVLLELVMLRSGSDRDKGVEILLLRQQLCMLQRKQSRPPRISRCEKLSLLVVAGKLTTLTNNSRVRLAQVVFLFKPETLLKWHRELVRRKWTFRSRASRGRPSISPDLEALLLRLAKENPTWGYGKLHGELRKLSYTIGCPTIRDVLKRSTCHLHRNAHPVAAVGVHSFHTTKIRCSRVISSPSNRMAEDDLRAFLHRAWQSASPPSRLHG